MKKSTNTLVILLAAFAFSMLLSCSKKSIGDDPEGPGSIGSGDTRFYGMYIARDPRLNPSLPDHRYIHGHGDFSRLRNGAIFQGNTMSLIMNGSSGSAYIKTEFLPSGHSVLGLSSTQHARLLYVEYGNEKLYFGITRDHHQYAVGGVSKDQIVDNLTPWRREQNHWIIHDFTTSEGFRQVAIESRFMRGYYIMNAPTLNGDTRIRIVEQSSPNNATKWEIHRP